MRTVPSPVIARARENAKKEKKKNPKKPVCTPGVTPGVHVPGTIGYYEQTVFIKPKQLTEVKYSYGNSSPRSHHE